jgi:hypothetical protein
MMKYLANFHAKASEEMEIFVRFGWGNIWRIFTPKPVKRWKNWCGFYDETFGEFSGQSQ